MPDVLNEGCVCAGKRHRCGCCPAWIEKGEVHTMQACVDGGAVYTWRTCHACDWIINANWQHIYPDLDFGIGPEDVEEFRDTLPPDLDTYEILVDRYLAGIKGKIMHRHKKQREEATR